MRSLPRLPRCLPDIGGLPAPVALDASGVGRGGGGGGGCGGGVGGGVDHQPAPEKWAEGMCGGTAAAPALGTAKAPSSSAPVSEKRWGWGAAPPAVVDPQVKGAGEDEGSRLPGRLDAPGGAAAGNGSIAGESWGPGGRQEGGR